MALSARADGTRGPPPIAQGIYVQDPGRGVEEPTGPVQTHELTAHLATMALADAEAERNQQQRQQQQVQSLVTVPSQPLAAHAIDPSQASSQAPVSSQSPDPDASPLKPAQPVRKPNRTSQLRNKAIRDGLQPPRGGNKGARSREKTHKSPNLRRSSIPLKSPKAPMVRQGSDPMACSEPDTRAAQQPSVVRDVSEEVITVMSPSLPVPVEHPKAHVAPQLSLPGIASFDMHAITSRPVPVDSWPSKAKMPDKRVDNKAEGLPSPQRSPRAHARQGPPRQRRKGLPQRP